MLAYFLEFCISPYKHLQSIFLCPVLHWIFILTVLSLISCDSPMRVVYTTLYSICL